MLPNNPIVLNSPQPQSNSDRIKKLVSKKAIKGLSIVQLACAVIAIITHIILLGDRRSLLDEHIADIGTGVWTGFFFGVTGLIGLFTSQKPSKSNLSAFLALSIISAVICLPLITYAAIGLSKENWYLHKNVCEDMPIPTTTTTRYYGHPYYSPKYKYKPYVKPIARCSYYYESNCCVSEKTLDDLKSATACYGFQIFVALVQAGVAIAASAMSCRIVCCSKQDYSGGVVYSPAQNQPQQFMMVSPNQFSNPPQYVTVPSNQVVPFAQVASSAVMQQHGPPPPSYGYANQNNTANVYEASLI